MFLWGDSKIRWRSSHARPRRFIDEALTHARPRLARDRAGLSLLELIIVSGLLTGVVAGALAIMDFIARHQRDVESKISAKDVSEEIRRLMEDRKVCEMNFKGLALTSASVDIDNIRKFDNAGNEIVAFQPGKTYEGGILQLYSIALQNYQTIFEENGSLEIQLLLRRVGASPTSSPIYRKVMLSVTRSDPANRKIETCVAAGFASGDSGAICEQLGGRRVLGATPAETRCIFPQFIVSTDPALNATPAMLHVRNATDDLFGILPDGRVSLNYSLSPPATVPAPLQSPVPTTPDTRLFVSGDMRVSNNVLTSRLAGNQVVIAPPGSWNESGLLNTPTGKMQPQLLIKGLNDDGGYTGFGVNNGQLFVDGGNEGHVPIVNSSLDPTGGFEFNWNPDLNATSPYPGLTTANKSVMLALRNSGGAGVGGYTLKGGPHPLPASAAGTRNGLNYSNVHLFVRGGILVEKDLYVPGVIYAKGGTNKPASDRRLKNDVHPVSDAISKVLSITGVRYRWKDNSPAAHRDREELGFIAQEVEKRFPEAVRTDHAGYKHVIYLKLLPALWQAFRDSLKRTEKLERDLTRLERLYCLDHADKPACRRILEGRSR